MLKPSVIEYPSYQPDTETGKKCFRIIRNYNEGQSTRITPSFVKESISKAVALRGSNIYYNPIDIVDNHNDNSIVKFFRIGSFQILSLGDCEDEEIGDRLQNYEILNNEVDILLLAHHGSHNSICSMEFLRNINPKVAICTSNYDNKFEHPDQAVRNRLNTLGIPYFTTKTGDIVIESIDKLHFRVYNYQTNNEKCANIFRYRNKTWYILD